MKSKILILFILAFLILTTLNVKSQTVDTSIVNGKYSLHFHIIKGNGLPILFEAGGGDDGTIWNPLLADLHRNLNATLITYDRNGFGKSGLDTNRIDIIHQVQDLENSLRKLGYNKKFFLVAHSLGGSYSIIFAARNPKKVAGAVFIDINTPCFMTEKQSEEIQYSYNAQLPTLKKERPGVYFLLSNYCKTNKVMADAAPKIVMPITVIGSDFPPYKGVDSLKWKNCLKSFAMERTNRKYILAKNTGHYVFLQSSKVVKREIEILYKKVYQKYRLPNSN